MKTTSIVAFAALCVSAASHDNRLPTSASSNTSIAKQQLQILIEHASSSTKSSIKKSNKNCTLKTLQIRREWGTLTKKERKSYIKAVKCLQSNPARSSASWAAGAKTRFDDWVATHIDQTLQIHYTGTFLGWHRWFLWEYEQALRNECGYRGTQPYWNWGITAETGFAASPIWNGDSDSMSGNGAHVNQTGLEIILGGNGLPDFPLPVGNGGGCVKKGPFVDMSVNLGPAVLNLPGNKTEANPKGPLSYNPRCLKRDLTDEIISRFANFTAIVDNIVGPKKVYDFQMLMQGIPGSGSIGIHGGGHYSMGGDPGRDVFVSPGDPAFYLHHSMIDLVWTAWQMLDADKRVYGKNSIDGTNTFLNMPPSANTTFGTPISIGKAGSGRNVTMRDVMSTVEGPFCYVYA